MTLINIVTQILQSADFQSLLSCGSRQRNTLSSDLVHGPDSEKAIFKEFVAPPLPLWFDASSRFLGHIGLHFHLLSVAQPGQ